MSNETTLTRIPDTPKGMNIIAAEFWKKKCADLKAMGKLSSNILESLEAYCNHLADMQKAREWMDKSWGQDMFFRYQKAYIEANKQQIALAREFGFTPLSDGKMPKTNTKKKRSALEGLD